MTEAKDTSTAQACELWRGPRMVLAPWRCDPGEPVPPPFCQRPDASGYDGVAWDLRAFSGQEALARIAGAGDGRVSCGSVACRCDATDVAEATDEVHALLAGSARLGACSLCLTLPPLLGTGRSDGIAPVAGGFRHYQEQLNFAGGLLHETRLACGSSGVTLAIEAVSGGGLLSPVELRELIDGAYAATVGVCLDLARLRSIGAALDWIDTLRHRLFVVRLPSKPVSSDEVDAVLAALSRCRFDRTIICPEPTWVPRCRAAMSCPA